MSDTNADLEVEESSGAGLLSGTVADLQQEMTFRTYKERLIALAKMYIMTTENIRTFLAPYNRLLAASKPQRERHAANLNSYQRLTVACQDEIRQLQAQQHTIETYRHRIDEIVNAQERESLHREWEQWRQACDNALQQHIVVLQITQSLHQLLKEHGTLLISRFAMLDEIRTSLEQGKNKLLKAAVLRLDGIDNSLASSDKNIIDKLTKIDTDFKAAQRQLQLMRSAESVFIGHLNSPRMEE